MAMSWHDLLFMHWPVPAGALRPHIPDGLEPDAWSGDGSAYLAVVPFRMTGVRHRFLPALPWLSAFPELNVRTYVKGPDGRAGVWFFTLDATQPVAIAVARAVFHLSYQNARMSCRPRDGWIEYESVRTRRGSPPAQFRARYRAVGPAVRHAPGTLEHFVTERYCLYAADARGGLYRGDIEHAPWELAPAAAEVRTNTMASGLGIDLAALEAASGPPLLHYVRRLDVRARLPVPVGR